MSRSLLFASIVGVTGAAGFRFLVLPRSFPRDSEEFRSGSRTAAQVGLLASITLVVAVGLGLLFQFQQFRDPFASLSEDLSILLFHTSWGQVWFVQLFVAFSLIVGFLVTGWRRWGWWIAAVGAVIIGCTPAFSGHAVAHEHFRGLALLSDCTHVLAAGVWTGGLAITLLANRWSVPLKPMVRAFSPLALACGALVVISGVVGVWLNVGSFAALESPYGNLLLLKLALAVAVFGVGAWNWRRAGPAVGEPAGDAHLHRSGGLEFLLAQLVLVVTAFLVGTSPPPGG